MPGSERAMKITDEADFARAEDVGFTIVGPEAPLVGLAFSGGGIPNGSLSPCTTRVGSVTASSSSRRDRFTCAGPCGRRGGAGSWPSGGGAYPPVNVFRKGDDLVLITDGGYGKRTKLDRFPRKGRGTMGVIGIRLARGRGLLRGQLRFGLYQFG